MPDQPLWVLRENGGWADMGVSLREKCCKPVVARLALLNGFIKDRRKGENDTAGLR